MTIDRRTFGCGVTAATVAAWTGAAGHMARAEGSDGKLPDLRALDPDAPPAPQPDGLPPPQMRRWTEQRWALDNIIAANGIDWDQPRLPGLAAALGPDAGLDIAGIRARVKKFADITPSFEAVARRREANAIEAEKAGAMVTARDNYYMASNYWASAQWPIDENSAKNVYFNQKKRETFLKYARLAEHRVMPAWVPLGDKKLPGWFHLPYGYQSGQKVPCYVSIPGMDGYKERSIALSGDRFLSRGIAVLVVEGPGQYESPVLGIRVSAAAWSATGPAMFNWLAARPEIDTAKIAIGGASFGSLFATMAAGGEPRYAAVAVTATCLEPGCWTIFDAASPTFKKRFMYMSGIADEARFEEFRKQLTWEGHVDRIKVPYLCIAGEADELCPLENTERMMRTLKSPKQLVVYADSRHSVGGVPSANLGPPPATFHADWVADRLAGKPLANEHWFVEPSGRVARTPYA